MRYKVSVKNVRECQVLSCSRGVFRGFGRLVVVVVVSCFCFQWFALRTPTEPVSYCLTKWLFFAGFCLFLPVTSRLTRLDTGFEEIPAKTCRHEWRHGTSGDARHVTYPQLSCSTSLVPTLLVPTECHGRKPLPHGRGSESLLRFPPPGRRVLTLVLSAEALLPQALRVCRWTAKRAFSLPTFRSYCSRRGSGFRLVRPRGPGVSV